MTNELEKKLIDGSRTLLKALAFYGKDPSPANWVRVHVAAKALEDTTFPVE